MVADSRHREKNFQNGEKTFIIEKKIFEYRKIFQSQKELCKRNKIEKNISQNRENYFKIEKNV